MKIEIKLAEEEMDEVIDELKAGRVCFCKVGDIEVKITQGG